MIPFEHIKETEDRSWSLKLVQEISEGKLEDIDQIVCALSWLDDHRAVTPLTELVEDEHRPVAIRDAASRAVATCNTLDTAQKRASWWASGDNVLMRHAVRMAERTEADLLETILRERATHST